MAFLPGSTLPEIYILLSYHESKTHAKKFKFMPEKVFCWPEMKNDYWIAK
jgi:hypothetical protein